MFVCLFPQEEEGDNLFVNRFAKKHVSLGGNLSEVGEVNRFTEEPLHLLRPCPDRHVQHLLLKLYY